MDEALYTALVLYTGVLLAWTRGTLHCFSDLHWSAASMIDKRH
jgi:hypothetical protein